MKKIIVFLLLTLSFLRADECDTKRFTLNAHQSQNSGLTLLDLLRDVTQTCHISVVFDDNQAKRELSKPLDMINIEDYRVDELFAFIFDDHNLFYTYDKEKKVVRVAYTKTVNFNVDYINMNLLSTTSSKSITVGAGESTTGTAGTTGATSTTGTTGATGSTGGGSNSDFTNIRAISTFTFWDQLHNHVQQILQAGDEHNGTLNQTLVNRDAAVVSVTGTTRQINAVKTYLDKLESRMHSQVMIDAYLIELTYNDYSSMGVNWSKFDLALNGSYSNYSNSLNNLAPLGQSGPVYSFGVNFDPTGLINFLKTYGDVEVLSNPKVLTLSNQPAVINVGQQLNYLYASGALTTTTTGAPASSTITTLGSIFVGLTLNIIPEVTDDGYIVMRINPVTSELINASDIGTSASSATTTATTNRTMPPDTRVKQMTSIVKVKDKQKVLIGGLIEKTTTKNDTKVPLIGDIPFLGRLFHNTENIVKKSELFILITPTLIKKDIFPTIDDAYMQKLN
ncbi:MAG: secretin N-terminal domain-containing protein [Sulfuricurvum sp.]|nr:secretin N-terminal domain-containing protein [Sulfuricurvum sp.]